MMNDKEKEIFRDVYRFYEKYKNAPKSNDVRKEAIDFWMNANGELTAIACKHKCGLANRLLLAVFHCIEDISSQTNNT